MRSPFLFYAGDRLSAAELAAARLDGHVVELGDAWIPADAVETAALRGGSLLALLGADLAATHLSAAWIHGAVPEPPARHCVQRAVGRRLHRSFDRRYEYRDPQVPAADLVEIGGALVTTPVRTLIDLARTGHAGHAEAAGLVAAWSPEAARSALVRLGAAGPFPRKREAMALIRRLTAAGSDQDEVTRYTS